MSNSNTPPSNVSFSTTTQPNSVVPPALDSPLTLDSASRRSTSTINSSRRLNMQSTAHSHSTAENSYETSGVNENEEVCDSVDPFETMIEEFNQLDDEADDGGDSDEEGVESEIFDEAFVKAMIERNNHEGGMHVEEINSGEIAFVIAEDGVMNGVEDVNLSQTINKVPDDWIVPVKREEGSSEPDFEDVDNPGGWNSFIFRPVYKKTGTGKNAKYKYMKHELPTGCRPVPVNDKGKRESNGWEFFYKGWKSTKFPNARDGATPDNLFPSSRSSTLDLEILINLGLSRERMTSI